MDLIDSRSVESLHTVVKAARVAFEAAVRVADGRWEEKLLEPENGGDEAWPPTCQPHTPSSASAGASATSPT
jgi:hypothetical protein